MWWWRRIKRQGQGYILRGPSAALRFAQDDRLRDGFGEPFAEAELGDLALLLGGFAEFGGGVVVEAVLEDGEDFGGGFSGGADDEDAVEFSFVEAVGCG